MLASDVRAFARSFRLLGERALLSEIDITLGHAT
jgi:hypothetical protein